MWSVGDRRRRWLHLRMWLREVCESAIERSGGSTTGDHEEMQQMTHLCDTAGRRTRLQRARRRCSLDKEKPEQVSRWPFQAKLH